MELRFIDNPVRLQAFLNEPDNTENTVEPGHTYYTKSDAIYLGTYEGLVLAGAHEVRNSWHSVVECHAVYGPGFCGEYVLRGHRLFCKWLPENSPFLNSITMAPDTTKYGRAIIRLFGATRVGHPDDTYIGCGKSVGVTPYQLIRQQYKEFSGR